MRTEENLAYHELIGLTCEVVYAPNPMLVGVQGVVVDERKEVLILERSVLGKVRETMVPKRGTRFRFTLPNGTHAIVEGNDIRYAPHDRTKKVLRKHR